MPELVTSCPVFGIGQVEGVHDYVREEIPRFCKRLGLCGTQEILLSTLVEESYHAAVSLMNTSLSSGMVEPTKTGRALYNFMSDMLVCPNDSRILSGHKNLETAMTFLTNGGNVLLVQNHRSGADSVITEYLLRKLYGKDIAADWAYMAGHAVNLCLIPLMFFASALRRFQIFSVKYKSMGITGADDRSMVEQNLRALRSLQDYVSPGGKLVVLYPEGGRGDNHVISGQGRTMKIPELMHAKSSVGLMILPTYMHGATSILPVARIVNEYNEILMRAQRGSGQLSIGTPVMWNDIQPQTLAVTTMAQQLMEEHTCRTQTEANSHAKKTILVNTVMGLIAALAPNDHERGPYACPDMKALVTHLTGEHP